MKALPYLVSFLTALVILTCCQKEPAPDNSQATGNLLKTAAGDCTPLTLGGTFVQNTALGTANYMDVQVDFTTTGEYVITSDTVNGYSFKGTGNAMGTGQQTVRLAGSGTPVVAGTDAFEISFNGSVCRGNVVVSAAVAVFTFGNTAGICNGVTVGGNYLTGVAMTPANTVMVDVNVTSPGSFSVSTDLVNGISFSKSGTFTSSGLQTIELTGNGTPVTAGSFSYLTAVSGGCAFPVTVTNPAGSLATLSTATVTGITCTSALSGGNITSDGGSAVIARGICYSTSANPTIAGMVVNAGSGTGPFTGEMTGLLAGTTYHVRAFATNSAGTAYGNDISFTTTSGCIPKIYVAGWHDVFEISGNIRTPKVWVNTTGAFNSTSLPFTLNMPAEANDIFVSGNDVYVAGKENGLATLWKNGIAASLSAAPTAPFFYEGTANAVYVSGTDVYVAGTYANAATIWKNGVATTLTTGSFPSEAHAVFVSGTDVYVAGYENKMINSNLVTIATVWKNGVASALTTGTANAVANSVFVSGSDVYAAGKEGTSARVWKNGAATTLTVSGGNEAVAHAVFVSGTDVYVAGTEDDGTSLNSYAKLWKNGVGTLLTTSGYRNAARSVYVVGADVYVAGARSTGGANTVAAVWRNGFFTPLTSGATDGVAYGIIVK